MEIGHGDRGCDRKPDNPSTEAAGAILPREPVESGRSNHSGRHAHDATDNCSDKESALPYSVPENRADHGSESREHPGGEKHAEGFQWNLPRLTITVVSNGSRISCAAGRPQTR